jgi:hypothetical protein
VKGNGNKTSQEKNIGNFTGVSASGSMDIIVTDGQTHSLRIETDENLIDYLVVKNDNGVVRVYTKDSYNLNPKTGIKVYCYCAFFFKA